MLHLKLFICLKNEDSETHLKEICWLLKPYNRRSTQRILDSPFQSTAETQIKNICVYVNMNVWLSTCSIICWTESFVIQYFNIYFVTYYFALIFQLFETFLLFAFVQEIKQLKLFYSMEVLGKAKSCLLICKLLSYLTEVVFPIVLDITKLRGILMHKICI